LYRFQERFTLVTDAVCSHARVPSPYTKTMNARVNYGMVTTYWSTNTAFYLAVNITLLRKKTWCILLHSYRH
jgi:hypothetical protein